MPPGVEIGDGSWIYSAYAFLHCQSRRTRPLRVGQHSGVYHGCFFDLGPDGEVDIGDYCAIVGAIINVNGPLRIGDYALIAHEVTIADSAWAVPPSAGARPSLPTSIGRNVWIGAKATVLSGVTIGEGAIVGAGAVVESDVAQYTVVVGVPARTVREIRRGSRQ
jgi:acetyltransferase-like isoleucine patch superfamily enzyme